AGSSGGTVIAVPVTAPVTVCGNAVGLLGTGAAGCAGGSAAPGQPGGGSTGGSGTGGVSAGSAGGLAAQGRTARLVGLAYTGEQLLLAALAGLAMFGCGTGLCLRCRHAGG